MLHHTLWQTLKKQAIQIVKNRSAGPNLYNQYNQYIVTYKTTPPNCYLFLQLHLINQPMKTDQEQLIKIAAALT